MGLTNKREQIVKEMPIIKASVAKSKDGKFLIHRTTITHIKPMSYYRAVVEDAGKIHEETLTEADLAAALEA